MRDDLLHRAMRRVTTLIFLTIAILLLSPAVVRGSQPRASTGSAASSPATSSVSLHVSAGYGGVYRDTAWTPIRADLHNSGHTDVRGTLELPQSSEVPSIGASPTFHGLYDAPVLLPAGESKHLTVYVPGSGVQGEVNARFVSDGRVLATDAAYVIGVNSAAFLVGVLSSALRDTAWIRRALQKHVNARVIALDARTIDTVPESLAAFSLIVLTDSDTSQLDGSQRSALRSYVQDGGSLLLIGGPSAAATLDPLPRDLLPGRLAGTRTVPHLDGLRALGAVPASARKEKVVVSLLSRPRGTVLAYAAGVPLVIRTPLQQGIVEYIAFDPALSPYRMWTGTPNPLEHIIMSAAPMAVSRTLSPQGFRGRLMRALSSQAITGELANLPPATLPMFRIIALLTLLYLLILGPANYLVLRALKRTNLSWITVPCLAVSYIVLLFAMSAHLKGSSVVLNSIGLITLDGNAGPQPATVYVGLAAPLPGDYHLTYPEPALPGTIAELNDFNRISFRSAATLSNGPLGVRVREGAQTNVTFLAMKQWSTRDVMFQTSVNVPGRVRADLVLNRHGILVGSIHNGTNLDILHPIVVAGQNVTAIPDIRAGATVRAHVQPDSNVEVDQTSIWTALFSRDSSSEDRGFGLFGGFGGFGDCCNQSQFAEEKSLTGRIQNAASMLSQVHTMASFGEVVMAGWSLRPIGSFTVNGSVPQQRNLTLVVIPVHVRFPSHGPFHLRPGTLGATLVDISPRTTQSDCCSFFSAPEQQISLGVGGSMTFEFDTPSPLHVRFDRLRLTVNSNDTGINRGDVFNWDTHRWMTLDLSSGFARIPRAQRIVSPTGKILVRFRATPVSGDITMDNPYEDVQISGSGNVT